MHHSGGFSQYLSTTSIDHAEDLISKTILCMNIFDRNTHHIKKLTRKIKKTGRKSSGFKSWQIRINLLENDHLLYFHKICRLHTIEV